MRILHVITSLYTGGAEKLMVDLLPRLKQQGHDVDLLLFDGTNTPFRQEAEAIGIKIYDFGEGGSVYSPFNLLKLIPFLRRYDVVHTHNTASQLFAALGSLFSAAKLITTEHNTSNRRRAWRWFKPIDRWMYNRYEKVICISQKAEENLRMHIGNCNAEICTINNGVFTDKYINANPSSDLEMIAPESRKIIMVAGFRWEKDQDTIIRALKRLPAQFHLFLVGDGERKYKLISLASTIGVEDRVHLLGLRSDVPQLLHASDYVVMSSHFEGLSLSSVEGMCVGKPFLASDVDGLREVVNGAGILFPHEDDETLANEILRLESSESLRNGISERCQVRAKEFDISKMAQAYSTLYNHISQ